MNGFELIGPLDLATPADLPRLQTTVLQTRRARLIPFARQHKEYAADYVATDALRTAVDVALSLGRPLLLTGEPGSGKTLAASWIAHRLGLGDDHFVEFQVRSDSRARDLRYDFDAVSWFRESQIAAAKGGGEVSKDRFVQPRALGLAFGWIKPEEDHSAAPPPGSGKPYVVLIDEIDKAPRDFPNDLLLELDQMRFVVDELEITVGPPEERPIIVITSNAERRLPDPFLRRCITHHIELTGETVSKILAQRLAEWGRPDAALIAAAVQFWSDLRGIDLTRRPTIAEYWQWLALATQHGNKTNADLIGGLSTGGNSQSLPYLSTLLSAADLRKLTEASRS